MMPSKNSGFTASDIERYHCGKLSPEERHALEKAALDDPFLADALEGYAFTPNPAADLAAIQSRLDEKLNQKKIIPLFQKYKWLSVAAVVLFIAGGGWLAYSISEKEKSSSIAVQKQNAKPQTEITRTQPPQLNEASDSAGGLVYHFEPAKKQQKGKQDAFKENANTTEKYNDLVVNELKDSQTISANVSSFNKERTSAAPLNEVATAPSTLANAQKPEANMNRALVQDNRANNLSGRAQGINKDSDVDKETATASLRRMKEKDTINNFNVVLQPQKMDTGEVVVVGYGSQKKATDAFSRITYPRVIIDSLEPDDGDISFDSYMASNLKLPEEERAKMAPGEIQLSFDVDENGKAINIRVIKSLCQKCDEEAIRLLKEGPKWKKKKDKKGKITIKF